MTFNYLQFSEEKSRIRPQILTLLARWDKKLVLKAVRQPEELHSSAQTLSMDPLLRTYAQEKSKKEESSLIRSVRSLEQCFSTFFCLAVPSVSNMNIWLHP